MKRFSFLLAMTLCAQPWAQTDCDYQPDVDPDWAIGVTDILALLGLFGEVDTDQDYIWDSDDLCTDIEACNFASNPTEACQYLDALGVCGGDCMADADADGVCDDVDDCVGEYDACGICNGPGEVYECGCSDIPAGDCDCDGNQLDAFGVCGGAGGIPQLLVGSWRFSTVQGAVSIGPSPYSSDWFASGANGLQAAQYDDVYTFNADGTLTTDYNGSIIDAFNGYSEQAYGCAGVPISFSPSGGTSGEDQFSLIPGACSCPFMGTNDGGLHYDIVELTANTLRIHTMVDDVNCNPNPAGGYFTYIFTRVADGTGGGGPGTDGEGYQGADSYPGMTLVWSDEFEGATINTNNWTYDIGDWGWGNNEWQNYTSSPNNSSVSDGYLTITARQVGAGYTSARMKSVDLQEFQFGRIDIRAKCPEGQGIWPALWMLGANFPEGGWPQCGEIDIMELVGHQPSTVHGTAHWGSNPSVHQYTGGSINLPSGQKFSDAFHLFSVVWEQNSITWYMDDQQYYSINSSQMNGQPYPFNAPFFFIMNIAVGGNWPGYPDASTQFPQTMMVDYVRVFQ